MRWFVDKVLKPLSILIGVVFTLGVMLVTGELFFGSSKIKPLFGMSADALAGPSPRADGGTRSPKYFPATKSAPLPLELTQPTDGGTPR